MTQTITVKMTKQEAARAIVDIIADFYTSDKMDITVGFTADGDVDYEFDVHSGDVVWAVYETKNGWTLGETDGEDYETSEFWTEEIRDGLAECFASDWDMDDQSAIDDGWDIEYEVEKEESKAIAIIRRNTNYTDAYTEMADCEIEHPDAYWHKYIDQCGEDAE